MSVYVFLLQVSSCYVSLFPVSTGQFSLVQLRSV